MANINVSVTDGNNLVLSLTPPNTQVITIDRASVGPAGPAGVSITSVSLASGTHAPGTLDTYNVNYSVGSPTTFQVYNGADGAGGVTSVGLSAPTFLSVSNSPITTTGTLALSYSGTALPIANGGTNATTADAALTSLGAYAATNPNGYTNNTGTVTGVTATSPVASSGGTTPIISIAAATSAVNGYLTSTDWTTFNNKQVAGTYVNSVSGTIGRTTSTGGVTPVIDLASGIATAGTTGSATLVPVVTIDTYGRVTSITTAANPQGTVTSVAALTLGTTGTDLSSSVATNTTTPVITLQVPTASATNRGALSSADWSTFNNKQPAGTYATGTGTADGANTGDNAANTNYANDYRLANFVAGTNYLTPTGTETVTNKRIDPRVSSTTSASSITPTIASFDQYAFTALAAALTINAPTGTPVDGDKLILRILDNGTSQTLTWNSTYTIIGVVLPTATTINKMLYVGCIYNAANTRWDVVAVTTQV